MDIEIKLEKNVEVLARLNKSVHDLQRMWHPTIFREYNYETMYKMFDDMLQKDFIYSLIAYSSNQPVMKRAGVPLNVSAILTNLGVVLCCL
jgi:hypothetical protein